MRQENNGQRAYVAQRIGRDNRRPGAEAGSESGTQVPRPMWDRGAELSQQEIGATRVEIVSLADFESDAPNPKRASDQGKQGWVARESNPEPTD